MLSKPVTFLIYNVEQCPDTQRIHYQGYLELSKALTIVKLLDTFDFPDAPHIETAYGSSLHNVIYCAKQASRIAGPYIFGTPRRQGERTDITSFRDTISTGASDTQLIADFPTEMAKYNKFARLVSSMTFKKRSHTLHRRQLRPRVIVLWSRGTGTGKTKYVYSQHSPEDIYVIESGTGTRHSLWFDDYQGEEIFLLDDFYGNVSRDWLLRFLDRYTLRVQTKGGHVYLVRRLIYITSNMPPHEWYERLRLLHHLDFNALERRIDYTFDFDNPLDRPVPSISELTDVEWSDYFHFCLILGFRIASCITPASSVIILSFYVRPFIGLRTNVFMIYIGLFPLRQQFITSIQLVGANPLVIGALVSVLIWRSVPRLVIGII